MNTLEKISSSVSQTRKEELEHRRREQRKLQFEKYRPGLKQVDVPDLIEDSTSGKNLVIEKSVSVSPKRIVREENIVSVPPSTGNGHSGPALKSVVVPVTYKDSGPVPKKIRKLKICWRCRRPAHHRSMCTNPRVNLEHRVQCFICKNRGHRAAECLLPEIQAVLAD